MMVSKNPQKRIGNYCKDIFEGRLKESSTEHGATPWMSGIAKHLLFLNVCR
jgi:hypothetical protein